ncbi:MAG: zinc-ribbon domain-containing protein [Firmicutes bacterium]|nr:zinc-ribbon domain-containing protein [Bacillota bacterium]
MYCSKCGSKVEDGVLYCSNCGEQVGQKDRETENVKVEDKKPGGGKGKAVIGIIAAVLVIVLIIVGVSVGKGSGGETDANQENNEIQEIDITTIYLPEYSETITVQEAMGEALDSVAWTDYEENGYAYVKGEGELLCTDEISRTITVILVNEETGFKPDTVLVEGVAEDPIEPILEEIYAAAESGDNSILAAWLSEEEAVEEEENSENSGNTASNDVMTDAAQVMMNLLYDAVFNWDNNSASLYSLWNQGMQAYEYALGDVNGDGHGDAVIKLSGLNDLLIVYSVNGLYYAETVSSGAASGLDWHGMEYIQSRGWSLNDDYLMSFDVNVTFY